MTLWAIILALALLTVNPAPVTAQQGSPPRSSGLLAPLFADQPQLFANDGRIKLLVLGLNPFGLTESATEQIGLILQKNLTNTGHFDVVGAREVNAAFESANPELVDCREIACGVESGKRLGADFVVVGTLKLQEPEFILNFRLINITNNLTDFEDEVRFDDETMDEELFRLANGISRNSLLRGRVLSTSIRGIVISLGRQHGLELGDHLVIFKEVVPITDLEGQQVDTQRKNVAIVKVLNVNPNSAEAIIVHRSEEIQVGYFVHTYLDNQRQINLVEHTRRELDTGIRLANRLRPLELAPVVVLDTERQDWLKKFAEAEDDRDFWFIVGLVAGGISLFILNDFDNESSDQTQLAVAGGTFGYAAWKWFSARDDINDLLVEGRGKGYVRLDVLPILTPQKAGIQLALRF